MSIERNINRTIDLIDLSSEISILIHKIAAHEIGETVTQVNSEFHSFYEIRSSPNLTNLLNSINERLRKIQIIHYTYFADLNDGIINGNLANLPFECTYEFHFGTNIFVQNISFKTAEFYKEIVSNEFQTFVLTTASIFENIVRLLEVLGKKVVVHQTKHRPLSTPLVTYLDYLDSLLRLNYRSSSPLVNCIEVHRDFLNKYLETINALRNSYIHGYEKNLEINSGSYLITMFKPALLTNSPYLELKVFSQDIVEKLNLFLKELITTLISEVSSNASLPF